MSASRHSFSPRKHFLHNGTTNKSYPVWHVNSVFPQFLPALCTCDQIFFQAECRLQMEAQHISLTQIHAAQLELLQEGAEARTHSQELRNHTDQGEHTCMCVCVCACVPFSRVLNVSFRICCLLFMFHPRHSKNLVYWCIARSLYLWFLAVGCNFLHNQL